MEEREEKAGARPFAFAASSERFKKWASMNLREDLVESLCVGNLKKPLDMQQQAIPSFAAGQDVVIQGPEEEGKTTALLIGLLNRIQTSELSAESSKIQAIAVFATREEALAGRSMLSYLSSHMKDRPGIVACISGIPIEKTLKEIKGPEPVHILCATPGTISRIIKQRRVVVNHINQLLFVGLDKILESGFDDEALAIFRFISKRRGSLPQLGIELEFMPSPCLHLIQQITTNPVLIKKNHPNRAYLPYQYFVDYQQDQWKYDTLREVLKMTASMKIIIFRNTRRHVDWLANKMEGDGLPVSTVHSGQDPEDRRFRLADFAKGSTHVLVLTDIVARGMDFYPREDTAIINYDMPSSSEAYVFRIGRMGRSGMSPIRAVICFVTQGDYLLLQEIERRHGGGAIEPLPRDVPHLFPLLPCVNS